MRATDNYLRKHDDPEVIEKRGIFDKVFVREFAKLRQGFEILGTLIFIRNHTLKFSKFRNLISDGEFLTKRH